ncbi:MAG: endonuclease/exonuclease/phosphatase family protein [Rubripirellula sp.]
MLDVASTANRGWLILMTAVISIACGGVSLADDATHVSVLQLNLWQEGTSVAGGFEKIVNVIVQSKADVVTLSEVRNYNHVDLHERLIAALAKSGHVFFGKYVGGDAGVLSRFPLSKSELVCDFTGEDSGCVVASHLKLPDGQTLVICSAHLDYKNFATYLPRGYDGNSFKPIDPDADGNPNPITDLNRILSMDAASKRDESHLTLLDYAKMHRDKPIIYAGDFNECSHLDWTPQTKDLLSHNGVVIRWQNSTRLMDAGFIDAYREIFPNPVTHGGATWPSEAFGRKSTSWAPKVDERDRIDFVYYKGRGLKARRAVIVGSPRYYVYDRLEKTLTKDPFILTGVDWPSDHKGLLVEFTLDGNASMRNN